MYGIHGAVCKQQSGWLKCCSRQILNMKQLLNGNECKQQCFEIQDRLAQMLQ